jgi:hypothetical protein
MFLNEFKNIGERRDGCVDSETRTGEWSEESSKQDFAVAKLLWIPLVTQKSSRSGNLFRSVGQ